MFRVLNRRKLRKLDQLLVTYRLIGDDVTDLLERIGANPEYALVDPDISENAASLLRAIRPGYNFAIQQTALLRDTIATKPIQCAFSRTATIATDDWCYAIRICAKMLLTMCDLYKYSFEITKTPHVYHKASLIADFDCVKNMIMRDYIKCHDTLQYTIEGNAIVQSACPEWNWLRDKGWCN